MDVLSLTLFVSSDPDEGTNYQELLVEMTGQKTVPNVFINKTHVGGWDKTKQVGGTTGLSHGSA